GSGPRSRNPAGRGGDRGRVLLPLRSWRQCSPAVGTGAGCGAPKIACFAPGTPYSYGPPTTCGTSGKLKIGGGESTCHSSVIAFHGLPATFGPCDQDQMML